MMAVDPTSSSSPTWPDQLNEKSGPPSSSSEMINDHFIYDPNDQFYMAPAVCRLFHYRQAAVACGIVEVLILLATVASFITLHLQDGITNKWITMFTVVILALAIITTAIMIYGIASEQPKFLRPQMAFLHVEIILLIVGAVIAITSMSMGIHTTHQLFGFFVSVPQMEENFGPIWPFNMAVISFFLAAIAVWFHIIIRGCYDYLLDKEYFAGIPQVLALSQKQACDVEDLESKKPM